MVSGRSRLELFVAVKGHAFPRDAFEAMLRGIGGIEPTMVDQPAAAALLNPDAMRDYDAILFYDMPGLDFGAPVKERPGFIEPDACFRAGFEALMAEGKGMVALHHAIAGWPAWPAYAEALGGTFLYKPAEIRGVERPASRYAPEVAYTVRKTANHHPVLGGLPERFDLRDELYAHEMFDDAGIEPLLYRETPVAAERFLSAMHAVRRMPQDDMLAEAPPLDVPIAWAKAAGSSPLVYLQPGDGAEAYANPHYRRLVGNAIRWVASAEGKAWAASR